MGVGRERKKGTVGEKKKRTVLGQKKRVGGGTGEKHGNLLTFIAYAFLSLSSDLLDQWEEEENFCH